MDIIQIRRDTVANWTANNPRLSLGEVGIVTVDATNTITNPVQFKVGDGNTQWNSLPLQVANSPEAIATVKGLNVTDTVTVTTWNKILAGSQTLQAALNLKANDDTVVHLASQETITGQKTFSGGLNVTPQSSYGDTSVLNQATINAKIATLSGSISSSLALETQARISGDTTVSASIQDAKEKFTGELVSGSIVPAYADDLKGTSTSRIEDSWSAYIRTTAGDLDTKSDETIQIRSLIAICDTASNSPFSVSAVRFNGFNALNPNQVLTSAKISGTSVESDSNYKVAYFRCVRGIWGSYGTSTENNGYLFTDKLGNKVTPVAIKECATIPAVGTSVATVNSMNYGGYTYYLPATSGNYLCVQFASSVDLSSICAHIAWSNKDDDKYVAYVAGGSGNTLTLSGILSSRFNSTMNGIVRGSESACDSIEISGTTATSTKRCSRVQMSTLGWTVTSSSTEETTTYIYKATISAAKFDGLYQIPSNLTLQGNINYSGRELVVESTSITSIADLQTALGSHNLVYELNSYATYKDTLSNANSLHGNDMGTEEVVGATNLNFKIVTTYVQGLKDYLRGLPAELDIKDSVIAQALAANAMEIENLKSIVKTLQAYVHDYMVPDKPVFLEGSGSPVTVPDTVWQFYRDNVSNVAYVSMANTSSVDWKRITNI